MSVLVLGGREEGEGHPRKRQAHVHMAESWGEGFYVTRGETRGLNGAEQAEGTRRGPCCGGRTTAGPVFRSMCYG